MSKSLIIAIVCMSGSVSALVAGAVSYAAVLFA